MAIFDWEWGGNSVPRKGQKIPCVVSEIQFELASISKNHIFRGFAVCLGCSKEPMTYVKKNNFD